MDKPYPWKGLVSADMSFYYVMYPVPDRWNVQAITVSSASFENKRNLPESWAGLDGEQLAKVTGIEDALFCHRMRFICAAKTKEGALALAQLALK